MFKPKTINTIISDLNDKVNELFAHSDKMADKAIRTAEQAEELLKKSDEHQAEADHAKRVAMNIGALLQ